MRGWVGLSLGGVWEVWVGLHWEGRAYLRRFEERLLYTLGVAHVLLASKM